MYKFNFLHKINLMKLEEEKRRKFVKNIFTISTFCIIVLLGLIFFKSTMVGSMHNEMTDTELRISEKTTAFRKADFFPYKSIQHVYNVTQKRRSISKIFDAVDSSIDSNLVLNDFRMSENAIFLRFISKTQGSKSQLMTNANILMKTLSEKILATGYLDKIKGITISKLPDIKNTVNDIQYWDFEFNIPLKPERDGVKTAKAK
jgi:hypothetical protein